MDNKNSVLFTRRSVRVFNDKPISIDQINYMLKAAMYSPSASNGRPWEFVVSQNREHFIKIIDACPYYAPLKTAQAVILVCYNNKVAPYPIPSIMAADCGAATQNILLAAKEQNLGSVWMAVDSDHIRVDAAKKLFNLPDNILPFSIVAIGHHDTEINVPHNGFDDTKVHFETYKDK